MCGKIIVLKILKLPSKIFKFFLDFLRPKCYTGNKGRCENMVSVFDVANWFLSKQSMTHKKIQKMCYYAQAWHCALIGDPLFSEEIQAWIHGPVIPKLYPKYADYGWNNIPVQNFDESIFSEDSIKVLESVFVTYSTFTGDQLENLTHSEDPWNIARGDLKPWEPSTNPIDPTVMRAFYRQKYEEAQND